MNVWYCCNTVTQCAYLQIANITIIESDIFSSMLLLMSQVMHHICVWMYSQKYVIVMEEEVIPTTDLLHYMSQCLPVLDYDDTLIGATAWNENGVAF